ncbi:threonylcarbamoyl-AMP synthase [archaeon]|nr:threonylcarbamoyl-AMP synthase [archaeon]
MRYSEQIKQGKIFIYPTDTIYGIGCDATNVESVEKIKEMKGRDKDKPLSVIAPSVEWIGENLVVDCDLDNYLPGAYTLILKKKNPEFLKHVASGDSLGVRIPDCEFTKEIQKAGVPFITTSVNLSGEPFAVSIIDVKDEIKEKVDVIVDVGELNGQPSTLVIGGKEIKR